MARSDRMMFGSSTLIPFTQSQSLITPSTEKETCEVREVRAVSFTHAPQ